MLALFDYVQENSEDLVVSGVADLLDDRVSDYRVKLALEDLEQRSFIRTYYNGADHYQITKDGYRYIEDSILDSPQRVTLEDTAEAELLPASDRMVPMDHNSRAYTEISEGIDELAEELRGANDLPCSAEERDRLFASMAAAKRLWESAQLKLIQIKVGIIIAIQDAVDALSAVGKAAGKSALVDAIKAFVKSACGLDV
jgi:hypothetical protein